MSTTDYPRRRLDEFQCGLTREAEFEIAPTAFAAFIAASGDRHPLHVDTEFARQRGHADVILHGMCIAARSSHFITREFVGSHGLLVSMSSDFRRPVFVNDRLCWRAEVVRVDAQARTVEVKWQVTLAAGALIQRGTACAWIAAD